MQKTSVLVAAGIIVLIAIVLASYVLLLHAKPATAQMFSITVALLASHNSTPISQAIYSYNGSTFTCMQNTQAVSGAVSCFAVNQSDVDNFTSTFNVTVSNSTNATIHQEYYFNNIAYSSGVLSLNITALANITNKTIIMRSNEVANYSYSGKSVINSSLSSNLSKGGSYTIRVHLSKGFLQYRPELCIDKDCQMLSCASIKDYLATASQNLNPLNATALISGIGFYCGYPYDGWSSALSWMDKNIGPSAPNVLSWWDYGDWISWYGNSNPVLVSANPNPNADYDAAAQYVLSGSERPQSLASYMKSVHAKYIVFDSALLQKWLALDFLACIDVNQTSLGYAISMGQQSGTNVPVLGLSTCEHLNGPLKVVVPLSSSLVTGHCGQSSVQVRIFKNLELGNSTYCISNASFNKNKTAENIYSQNGSKIGMLISANLSLSYSLNVNGETYLEFLGILTSNSPNVFSVNSLTSFYNSTYYQGFMLGNLPGFKQVYPDYINGTNYVNYTQPIRIYQLLNYTG